MSKTVMILLMVYFVLVIAVMYPVIPVLVDKLAGITNGFNAIFTYIGVFISSLFGVEMQYVISLAGTYYIGQYAEYGSLLAMMFQVVFGLVSFVAPTSALLMIGLSHTETRLTDWIKFIWKFVVIMFVITTIILLIIGL